MKFREYLENLQELTKENPEILDMEVIAAIDDEGNGYNEVYYTPTLGIFIDGEFIPENDEKYLEENEYTKKDFNAICIN